MDVIASESEIVGVLKETRDGPRLRRAPAGLRTGRAERAGTGQAVFAAKTSRRLPVVLVTGQGNEEVALQALKLGASDYLVKRPGYLYRLTKRVENGLLSWPNWNANSRPCARASGASGCWPKTPRTGFTATCWPKVVSITSARP